MPDYWERRVALLQKQKLKPREPIQEAGSVLQLASIVTESIVDGPGLRYVVFTQGCPHRCPGCHNPQTHLPLGGTSYTHDEVLDDYLRHPASRGITLSGGEPFEQAEALAKLAQAVQAHGDTVMTYTGYRWAALQKRAMTDLGVRALLVATDLLIDGRFLLEFKSLEAPFVGSTNQRLIACSPAGNALIDAIPLGAESPRIERIRYPSAP